jgi:hypothetical protein
VRFFVKSASESSETEKHVVDWQTWKGGLDVQGEVQKFEIPEIFFLENVSGVKRHNIVKNKIKHGAKCHLPTVYFYLLSFYLQLQQRAKFLHTSSENWCTCLFPFNNTFVWWHLSEWSGLHLIFWWQIFETQFHYHRVVFSSQLRSKVGNILDKTTTLWITLNIDGTPFTSRSHTHPSCKVWTY